MENQKTPIDLPMKHQGPKVDTLISEAQQKEQANELEAALNLYMHSTEYLKKDLERETDEAKQSEIRNKIEMLTKKCEIIERTMYEPSYGSQVFAVRISGDNESESGRGRTESYRTRRTKQRKPGLRSFCDQLASKICLSCLAVFMLIVLGLARLFI